MSVRRPRFEWWWVIAARSGAFAVAILGGSILYALDQIIPLSTLGIDDVFISLVGLIYLASIAAPIAVYKERKALKETEWMPSKWYYLLVFPAGILGFVLSPLYVYKRLKYIGTS